MSRGDEHETVEADIPARPVLTGRMAVLVVVLGGLLVVLAWPVKAWFAQRAQIHDLSAGVAATQAEVDSLQAAQQRWADPAYVIAQARTRLRYVLPGEVGYVVIGGSASAPDTGGTATTPTGTTPPWWSQVWGSVRAADQPAAVPAAGGGAAPAASAPAPSTSPR